MSVALDLGNWQFRSLRRQGDRLIARACRAVYAIVQDSPARRSNLIERHVTYAEFGNHLILFGDAAENWSHTWNLSPIPLSVHGELQLDDRIIRQVLAALIQGLLPAPRHADECCCLTMPISMTARDREAMEFLAGVLRNLGYRPQFTSQGLSVALAELSDVGLSGVGVNLGTRQCEFSIVRHGRELARCRIPRGFSPAASAAAPSTVATDGVEIALTTEDILREIFATAAFEMQRRPEWKALATPITLAISGGMTAAADFRTLLPACVQHAAWPFALREVRVAADPTWAVCRGCLIQAELEELTAISKPAA